MLHSQAASRSSRAITSAIVSSGDGSSQSSKASINDGGVNSVDSANAVDSANVGGGVDAKIEPGP